MSNKPTSEPQPQPQASTPAQPVADMPQGIPPVHPAFVNTQRAEAIKGGDPVLERLGQILREPHIEPLKKSGQE